MTREGFFQRDFCLFFVGCFLGVFLCFLVFFFVFRALARFFFFGGGMSKTGNSRSVEGPWPTGARWRVHVGRFVFNSPSSWARPLGKAAAPAAPAPAPEPAPPPPAPPPPTEHSDGHGRVYYFHNAHTKLPSYVVHPVGCRPVLRTTTATAPATATTAAGPCAAPPPGRHEQYFLRRRGR